MATITEDYCDFETAKLLKEKGFDTAVRHYYQKIDDDITYHIEDFRNWNVYDMWYSIPTLQMAMKWLREVHNIHIVIKSVIRLYEDTEYYYELYGTKNKSLCISCDIYKGESWDNNEQATEAAIKYCLENLI